MTVKTAVLRSPRKPCSALGTADTNSRRQRAERGTAMVEFALVVPVYFLLLFGAIQFSIVFFGYCNATYACQKAVRYAVVHGGLSASPCSSATLNSIVTPYLWGAPVSATTVTSTWSPNNSPGSTVTVKVSILYQTQIPFSSLRSVPVGTSASGTVIY